MFCVADMIALDAVRGAIQYEKAPGMRFRGIFRFPITAQREGA
jgi:hypothetical protein